MTLRRVLLALLALVAGAALFLFLRSRETGDREQERFDTETLYVIDPADHPADALPAQLRAALSTRIRPVVDKSAPSPTGDNHDYVSYARYWWPDPTKPGGLPFIRRDGYVNLDQIKQGDEIRFETMAEHVETLALGWSVLHREDCARRAAAWLRAWFVAPATRMNPQLEYSQIHLGHNRNDGTNEGVLDGRTFGGILDAVRLLHGAPGFGADDEAALRAWFGDYDHWLTTSPNGRKEHAAPNNHGSWFLAQATGLARFLGHDAAARQLAMEDERRIAGEIRSDGSQPLELARADGLNYSLFNLQAQFEIVRHTSDLGVDLLHYQAPSGGGLLKALEYLRPYNADPSQWPGHELRKYPPGFLDRLLRLAYPPAAPAPP